MQTLVRPEHQEEKLFECNTCRKSYSNKENLWAHIAQSHEKSLTLRAVKKVLKQRKSYESM